MDKLTKEEVKKLRDEVLEEFKNEGFKFVTDKEKKITIVYSEMMLFTNTNYSTFNCITSIAQIRQPYLNDPNAIEYGQNITHKEVLKRIDLLEKYIKETINKLNDGSLFNYLPLTKKNRFNKAKNITVYRPNIQFAGNNGEYFSQHEIALQIIPLGVYMDNPFRYYTFDDIAILQINTEATLYNVLTAPIINDLGVFSKPLNGRRHYIEMEDLVPGAIYKDAKGNTNLYIGELYIQQIYTSTGYSEKRSCKYFIKLTSKWEKILNSCSNMNDFMYIVIKNCKEKHGKGYIDWEYSLLKCPDKIKFLELERSHFSGKDALVDIQKYPNVNQEVFIKTV